MNLLEIVADVSSRAHDMKEAMTANAKPHVGCTCCSDYCRAEVPTGVLAFRGGTEVVAMTLNDHQFKYPVDIAARLYCADTVGLIIDGRDRNTDKSVVIATAVNRAGDEMWRVEPYSIAPDGRSVIWWPAEVPDEHPLLEPEAADMLVKIMNKAVLGQPPYLDQLTPGMTFEQRRTVMDIGITQQIVKNADKDWHNIGAVTLGATPGSERHRMLEQAGNDLRLWL